jgi:hypothetical protein
MTTVLIRRENLYPESCTWGKSHVEIMAKSGVIFLQAKDHQIWAAHHQGGGGMEQTLLQRLLEKLTLRNIFKLDFDLQRYETIDVCFLSH